MDMITVTNDLGTPIGSVQRIETGRSSTFWRALTLTGERIQDCPSQAEAESAVAAHAGA
jgi:hypothetical protein